MKSLPAAIALSLAACATPQMQPAPQNLDYGQAPQEVEAQVRSYMENELRDAESARYKFEPPYKVYANLNPEGLFVWHGYRVDFSVNAKNGYGGYTGYTPYFALFRNGKITRAYPAHEAPWTFTAIRN